jgi:hypothetical protein
MNFLSKAQAELLADDRVKQLSLASDDQFDILHSQTIELEQGWIFFFNTLKFIQTQNPIDGLAGNAPILITKFGDTYELSTAISWQESIRNLLYELSQKTTM